jgi:hypothetical protein
MWYDVDMRWLEHPCLWSVTHCQPHPILFLKLRNRKPPVIFSSSEMSKGSSSFSPLHYRNQMMESYLSQRLATKVPDMWTDEMMALWVPIAIYWIQCSLFEMLMRLKLPFFEKYRIHSSIDRSNRNRVSFANVLYMVALQHVLLSWQDTLPGLFIPWLFLLFNLLLLCK